ncbi:MAG: TrkH family potassium uptake protein [bacterium]|uniref:TrkH family potassium uptake protein n=1 Tax=Gemmiger sp. TaxID=2049027 RepID=UPI002A91F9CE|nr:TrkH family potassium uptake protein [Gemmiger sp.]MDD6717200.1 TrkH family potassium uptake protein [bacterium]MDY5325883.1 TrkH family potassium uptake protein [Gemmiger sp.]
MPTKSNVPHRFSPAQIIVLGFFVIILSGTVLLMLPFSTRTRTITPFLDALFTATSATCVTGLVVYDTWTHWSLFGQFVILLLIQIGGMGFVAVAVAINMLRGTKIGLRQRFLMQETSGLPQMAGILRATRTIFFYTALFEGLGAVVLSFRFVPRYGPLRGLWYGVFHSISAFCNAGFDLMGHGGTFSSMTAWMDDPAVVLTLSVLIIIGGLGFPTWLDLREHRRHLRRCRLQTKLIIGTTLVLLALPFLFFFFYEFRLPQWADYTPGQKFWAALFQTVTPRTAGFNTVDYALFSGPGLMLTVFLMLVGGSPGSTAGGVKTTTLAAVFLSVRSTLRRRRDVEAFGRRLEDDVLSRATVLVFVYLLLFLCAAALICMIDGVPLSAALFETASAIGTVGLSLGLTPTLSAPSHVILIFLMYFGRVGGLTMIYALADPNNRTPGRRPQEQVTVG